MLLGAEGQIVGIEHQRMGCEDEEDDHLLETAVRGGAQYIVSDDRKVYDPPPHVLQYLEQKGIVLRRPYEFCDDLDALEASNEGLGMPDEAVPPFGEANKL